MNDDQRRLLQRHDEVRGLFRMVTADHRMLPGRRQLRDEIEKALPHADHDAVFEQLVGIAERANDAGVDRMEIRQRADLEAVKVLEQLQADDRLVDAPEEPEIDVDDVVDRVTHPLEDDEARQRRREAEAEKQRLRDLGVQVR